MGMGMHMDGPKARLAARVAARRELLLLALSAEQRCSASALDEPAARLPPTCVLPAQLCTATASHCSQWPARQPCQTQPHTPDPAPAPTCWCSTAGRLDMNSRASTTTRRGAARPASRPPARRVSGLAAAPSSPRSACAGGRRRAACAQCSKGRR